MVLSVWYFIIIIIIIIIIIDLLENEFGKLVDEWNS
jgi:hypothetical protein